MDMHQRSASRVAPDEFKRGIKSDHKCQEFSEEKGYDPGRTFQVAKAENKI